MGDGRRLGLVIGSQCEAAGQLLSFLPAGPGPIDPDDLRGEERLLVDLHELLVGGPGECKPVPETEAMSTRGLLLNPTTAAARAALEVAMDAAHAAAAVLVVHVLAHGAHRKGNGAVPDGHLLQMWDSPLDAAGEPSGWDLYDDIARRYSRCPGIAGLVLTVDACFASWAEKGIKGWANEQGSLVCAVLAASGDQAAWDACLTREVTDTLRSGLVAPRQQGIPVAEMRAEDIEPLATKRCTSQAPRIFGFENRNPVLYLGRNRAAERAAAELGFDGVTADVVQRLTSHYVDHASRPVIEALTNHPTHRVVAIVDKAGTGKSTLAAALRCPPSDSSVPPDLVDAAVFVSATPQDHELAFGLRAQLWKLPDFDEAARRFELDNRDRLDTLSVWQRELIGPLSLFDRPVRLLIDGIDERDNKWVDKRGNTRSDPSIRWALAELLEEAPNVSLLLVCRPGSELTADAVHAMPRPDDDTARAYLTALGVEAAEHGDLVNLASGSWLMLDLVASNPAARSATSLGDLYEGILNRARMRVGDLVDPVLELLAAAGTGPVLPFDVMQAALQRLGHDSERATLVRVLGYRELYRLVDRSRSGRSDERLGLFHRTLVDHISERTDLSAAHLAIAETVESLAPASSHHPKDFLHDPVLAYAFGAQPRHWWESGRPTRVVETLDGREDSSPRGNLDRWVSWSDRLQSRLGVDHADALKTRRNVAAWTGETGKLERAVALFETAVSDHVRVLGADHPETLSARNDLAAWISLNGDVRTALALLTELSADWTRVLGAADPAAFPTRGMVADLTAETGDIRLGLAMFRELLADQLRVAGADHPYTLTTRNNIAFWTGASGDGPGALALLESLLPDLERVEGPDHPGTLLTRSLIAGWTGRTGNPGAALHLNRKLLGDQRRVLGDDHPDTLSTRGNLAGMTGMGGDVAGALEAYEALLPDQERVLGPLHPDTLLSRKNTADWTRRVDDNVTALRLYEALLPDQSLVLGDDHPNTRATVAAIEELRRAIAGELGAGDD